ncbi:MAG: hypothetical protein IPM24_17700 [Bryobacterales bacterium]|nr:hypothetical protein [Bryobacterales bacterium]
MTIGRRGFLAGAGALLVPPVRGATPALNEPHFPSRLHQFVWRNWELANLDRMAEVAGCAPDAIDALGRSMGLPLKRTLTDDQLRRIYITVIRQNWHLLPREQMRQLLGWTDEKLTYTLKEDDFLDHKLGPKPHCEPVTYGAPDAAARRRASEMRRVLRQTFGAELDYPGDPPFSFIARLSAPLAEPHEPLHDAAVDPRYVYSYFALYGDPLMEPDLDPFPDGYAQRLVAAGVNGVWMQGVLHTLVESPRFPDFGDGAKERLANLARLAERLRGHGLKLYLYLNEPRAMPDAWFRGREHLRGSEDRGLFALCTAQPEVREWLAEGVEQVFRAAPALAGMFSISMSENFTNCFSRRRPELCPRCAKRSIWEGVGEALEAMHRGLRRASPSADFFVWDWAWPEELSRNLIPKLPRDAGLISVSEWSIPLKRGGVPTTVGEYSISVVGPGPRAKANWSRALDAGLKALAKMQINNTWEISATPYIPVPPLVARHCANLTREGVSGLMLSWTLGGYPSPNLEVAREFYRRPVPSIDEALDRVARARYGSAAPLAVEAWHGFSRAFEEFPYGVAVYVIPTQHGPANLLRVEPTGIAPSMILFPQDGHKRWSGAYPPAIAHAQFEKVASGWEQALPVFRRAMERVPAAARFAAREDLAIAEVCGLHFRSTANQFAFYIAREAGDRATMRTVALDEMRLARRLYTLARRHSVIGYEATNHYYYRPLDLAEKILNCRHVLDELKA